MKIVNRVSGNEIVGTTEIYNFREIEDPDHFNNTDKIIELDHCPFCGNTAIINGHGGNGPEYYGWCSICGTTGPKHWDWVKAARMWNDRSLKTIAECKGIDFKKWIEDGWDYNMKENVECQFLQEDPNTFPEVTLDQLLQFKDVSLTCDSEDDVWQYYFVKDKDAFVKIKKDIVVRYLDKKDADDTYVVQAEVTIYTKATCKKDAEAIAYNCISAKDEDNVTSITTDIKSIDKKNFFVPSLGHSN